MIVDSNILIYAVASENNQLRQFIIDEVPAVSAISYVEVLGYHRLIDRHKRELERIFKALKVLPLDQLILDQAVALRQQRKMGLGDALIAATALVHQRTLVTHNTADFAWVPGLQLLDPLAGGGRE